MPDLDVSFMVADPMFVDDFNIRRRSEAVSNKGRSVPSTDQVIPAWGTVVQEEDTLERVPDGQYVPRRIAVYTQAQVLGPVAGRQPDMIDWDGTSYVVTSVQPYARFGAGFYEVKAASVEQPDVAQ